MDMCPTLAVTHDGHNMAHTYICSSMGRYPGRTLLMEAGSRTSRPLLFVRLENGIGCGGVFGELSVQPRCLIRRQETQT